MVPLILFHSFLLVPSTRHGAFRKPLIKEWGVRIGSPSLARAAFSLNLRNLRVWPGLRYISMRLPTPPFRCRAVPGIKVLGLYVGIEFVRRKVFNLGRFGTSGNFYCVFVFHPYFLQKSFWKTTNATQPLPTCFQPPGLLFPLLILTDLFWHHSVGHSQCMWRNYEVNLL